jgi:hypothetical protein
VYSYSNPAGFTATDDFWRVFANQDICQAGGRGKRCVVSNDPAEAAIAPSSCKIYMGDVASGDTCELYIAGCQPAQRPLPTTGYCAISAGSGGDDIALWNADTGIAWYISPDNQARSLDDHKTYLADVLNGGKSDGVDYACLTDGCDLELPTLAQLQKLGEDCAAVAVQDAGTGGWIYSQITQDGYPTPTPGIVCDALWPDPTDPDNCAWSRTVVAGESWDQYGYAVCVVESGGGGSSSLIAVVIITAVDQTSLLPSLSHASNFTYTPPSSSICTGVNP